MAGKIAEIFKDGLWTKNPGLVQLLGLCPLLAVTSTATNALGLGLATIAVLTISNVLIAMIRRLLREEVRIIMYVIIIASVVTCVQLCMQAYCSGIYETLGLYISLIVTNCIIIARAEIFASKNNVGLAALDGLANGLGFTLVLLCIGTIRELIGNGTVLADLDQLVGAWGADLKLMVFPSDKGLLVAILPPGAFITLGLLVALKNNLDNRRFLKRNFKKRQNEETSISQNSEN